MGVKSEVLDLQTISAKLTDEILQDTVYKILGHKNESRVLSYHIDYASGKGDSYLGVVYRVQVTLTNNDKLSLIAKGMPKNVARRKLFHCKDFFATEHLFYTTIVPAMQQFERQHAEVSSLQVPTCYHSYSDGDHDFLLLEDLTKSSLQVSDRTAGLNSTQITAMLKMFARFHGVSFAMKILLPETFKEITSKITEPLYSWKLESWYSKNALKIANIFYSSIQSEISGSQYEAKLLDFIAPDKLYSNLVNNVAPREPTVICHGDIWLTNFMFSDSGKLCKAIDFQMLRYGSPMLDIATFIFSCVTKQQRSHFGGLHKILDVYRHELNVTVTSLGVSGEALHQLMTSPGGEVTSPDVTLPSNNLTVTSMTSPSSPVTSQGINAEQMTALWHNVGAHGFGAALALVPISVIDSDSVGDFDIDCLCEQGLGLDDVITQFGPITSQYGKDRLLDTLVFAVEENLI